MLRKNRVYRKSHGANNTKMIDEETWKIGTELDKMGKLIKYHIHVRYHKKHYFKKEKTFSSNHKIIHCCFLWMIAFKTLLDVIGKFKWIGKIMFKVIK